MKADILREGFLLFFQSRGHTIVPSDSLIPRSDPTVLFTSAGMNQFKNQFLGRNITYARASTSQKCLRTDDLDKVGKTCGHHTFFEMLGNFSFGDYFKEEAIQWAWEFLTKELNIPKDKLWVSIYKEDKEAYNAWKDKIGIPEKKIVKLGDKENFWPSEAKQKGPNGPCGPCSEIFFDQGKDIGCGRHDCNPSCDCNRFVEVWNLVFTQFERKEGGILGDLPHKNIDTGMGLERLAAVMQGAFTNFQTDLFSPIIKEIEEACGVKFNKDGKNKEAFYAISDHIRAITFAISDGVMPSNEERGYVVRNLIRRSLQHARNLGVNKHFLYRLIPVVASVMQKPYPELERRREDIAAIVKSEEEKFLETLNQTLPKFAQIVKSIRQQQKKEIPPDIVFMFRDTYGLPWDIIEGTATSFDMKIDWPRVMELLNLARARSRDKSNITDSIFTQQRAFKGEGLFDREHCELETVVVDLLEKKPGGKEIELILDKTPFYPEEGGQIGDCGVVAKGNVKIFIYDTKKIGDAIVHYGKIENGKINIGDKVCAAIDKKRRLDIARNHTATHLLQAALRGMLGEHVQQQGSLVADDRLRFDFTHFKALTKQELDRVEEIVNAYIKNNDKITTGEMPLDNARKMGALAFFGEKYKDRVRVVSVSDYSKELCGGTHLDRTGEIGSFKIVSESSVASGIRRIEAVTADFAFSKLKEEGRALTNICEMLGVSQGCVEKKIEDLLSKLKTLEKKLSMIKSKLLASSIDEVIKEKEMIKGKNLIVKFLEGYDADSLRRTTDLIKQKLPNSVIFLTTLINHKLFLTIGITDELVSNGLDALKIAKKISPLLGTSGGGRPDFAQAGGGDPSKLKEINKEVKKIIEGAI
ncbi:MAG: alanine--tRNA ligase [Candidatus Omnitrophota bacterium]|nr:alanine--tRNA ligase [Candidatus Omnitrophota bacterium]